MSILICHFLTKKATSFLFLIYQKLFQHTFAEHRKKKHTLRVKETNHPKDMNETYLRVTFGTSYSVINE